MAPPRNRGIHRSLPRSNAPPPNLRDLGPYVLGFLEDGQGRREAENFIMKSGRVDQVVDTRMVSVKQGARERWRFESSPFHK